MSNTRSELRPGAAQSGRAGIFRPARSLNGVLDDHELRIDPVHGPLDVIGPALLRLVVGFVEVPQLDTVVGFGVVLTWSASLFVTVFTGQRSTPQGTPHVAAATAGPRREDVEAVAHSLPPGQ